MSTYNKSELVDIITHNIHCISDSLLCKADNIRNMYYGKTVFFRGLIEFTNFCSNNCLYCGIRKSNKEAARYRLLKSDILSCCKNGYSLGFRSFVLQGGEDSFYDNMLTDIIFAIKNSYPDCALTISAGEKSIKEYKEYFSAGADRYLLRHETANEDHYKKLHPKSMSLKNRKQCLYNLKSIGFQTGAGFMVGSPYQTVSNLADDLLFLLELQPEMVGIGPFIPHNQTPFRSYEPHFEDEISFICTNTGGSTEAIHHPLVNATVVMVALTRVLLPKSMLPSTTALASIAENGRELAIKAGANVVMPNLSPFDIRQKYSLYDNKAFTGSEAAEGLKLISDAIVSAGFEPSFTRGDHVEHRTKEPVYTCD